MFAALLIPAFGSGASRPDTPISVCELARDLPAWRNQTVTVKGVNYYGLRQDDCPQKCVAGNLPSFIELEGGSHEDILTLAAAETATESAAEATGKRFEIWVTVRGRLLTKAKRSPRGPCDRAGWGLPAYGHLGVFPAELIIEKVLKIDVVENPKSPYDYAHMYHGAL